MKMIAAVPFALLTLGVLACTQHASTAPAVNRPAAAPAADRASATGDTNTFGENRGEATGSAANARAANYGSDSGPADQTSSAGAAAQPAPPK